MPMVSGSTEAEISIAYNEAHTSSPDRSWYRRLMNHGASYSVLGGGRYYLEGYREIASYGWQRATSYATAQDTLPYKCYMRSLVNGTWSDWQKAPTRAEIDALNTKIPAISVYTDPEWRTSVEFTLKKQMYFIGFFGMTDMFIGQRYQSGNCVISTLLGNTTFTITNNGDTATITAPSNNSISVFVF